MTSEEQAFLKAIAANPKDEVGRLAFSDWLEERNDPRYLWVRDEELWAWMGDEAKNPIPRLLAEYLAALAEEDASETGETDRIFGSADIQRLLSRCGPSLVPELLPVLRRPAPWPDFAYDLLHEQSQALADKQHELQLLLESTEIETRYAATRLLVSASEAEPHILDGLLLGVLRADDLETRHLLSALSQARGAAADYIAGMWCEHLERELAAPEPDDPYMLQAKLQCLADMPTPPERAAETFAQAVKHPRSNVVDAGSAGLAKQKHSVGKQLADAVWNCNSDTSNAVIDFAERAYGEEWSARLMDFANRADLPTPARLGLLYRSYRFYDANWPHFSPFVLGSIRHSSQEVRKAAIQAIQEAHAEPQVKLAMYRECLRDSASEVRTAAIHAVLESDYPPKVNVGVLSHCLGDTDLTVAETALECAANRDLMHRVLEDVRANTENEDVTKQARAAAAICRLAAKTSEGLEIYGMLMKYPDVEVRRAATHGLADFVSSDARRIEKPLSFALEDEDSSVRRGAARALGKLREKAKPYLGQLLDMIEQDSPKVAAACMTAVLQIDSSDEEALKVVTKALRDKNDAVVLGALEAIGECLYSPEERQIKRLLELKDHPSEAVRAALYVCFRRTSDSSWTDDVKAAAVKALRDPAVPVAFAAFEVVSKLLEKQPELLEACFQLFARLDKPQRDKMTYELGQHQASATHYAKLFASPDHSLRLHAMEGVVRLVGDKPKIAAEVCRPAVPHLRKLLTEEKGENLIHALTLLNCIGRQGATNYVHVVRLLEHSNPDIRCKAIATLGRLGSPALPQVPMLLKLLNESPHENERSAAGCSLISLGSFIPGQLAPVWERLHTDETDVRLELLDRTAWHPEIAAEAIPHLLRRYQEDDEDRAKYRVVAALSKFGEHTAAVFPQLFELIRGESNFSLREAWFDIFGELGAHAVSAVPGLKELYKQEEHHQPRYHILDAFVKIPVPESAKLFAMGLRDPHGSVRDHMATYLSKLGPRVVEILPQICRAISDPKWDNYAISLNEDMAGAFPNGVSDFLNNNGIDRRQFLILSITELGPAAAEAIPTLADLLHDKHEGVRHDAATALAAIGEAARDALKKAAKHRDQFVSAVAREALDKLDE